MMLYRPALGHRQTRDYVGWRIGVAMALALTVVSSGFAINALWGYAVEARLARAVEEAALAGGRVKFVHQRDGHIRRFFEQTFPNGFLGAEPAPLAIIEDPQAGTLTVSGRATVHVGVLALLGLRERTVEARAVIPRSPNGRDAGGLPRIF